MKEKRNALLIGLFLAPLAWALAAEDGAYGPAAALKFARDHRGEICRPNELYCYPGAVGIPFSECDNIIPLTATLWTPAQILADFQTRTQAQPATERKKGIIVLLKTERCATKIARLCTVTTAALEKRSTPLVGEFLIYGVWLKPRDGDNPPGSLKLETGDDAWKNDAAGQYHFKQGPGATLAFLSPRDGAIMERTDAMALELSEADFVKNEGRAPRLQAKLEEILRQIQRQQRSG